MWANYTVCLSSSANFAAYNKLISSEKKKKAKKKCHQISLSQNHLRGWFNRNALKGWYFPRSSKTDFTEDLESSGHPGTHVICG